jgi:hypothetical protein
MNQVVCEQLRLDLGKSLFMFVFLASELSLSPSLGSISKRVKLKHSNMFVNKFVNMRLDSNKYNIICLYICIYKIYL